ncbi:sugar-binding domain-containing protein [Streptomyces sp. NPDC047841]|uniref:glycoside hydrolase family 2 protein n=1 Tax=Streptomyces sp. NPDC047841 TaxID=3154708 RepID=UPI0034546A94
MSVPHSPDQPRPEYPRPQFVRDAWLNLNGTWQFEIDLSDTGLERGLAEGDLADLITVPFCPESSLSGIQNTDFLEAVWYRRTVTVPEDWTDARVLLHFGAVDHDTTVWANGVEVARHRGGFTPFTADLDGIAEPGSDVTLVVRARDSRHGAQARGKQATWYANSHCHYTRTTGIWQTVWMEPVPRSVALKRPRITPDVSSGSFYLELPLTANLPGHRVRAVLSDESGEVVAAEARADLDLCPRLVLAVPEDRVRLWAPEDPHLYGLRLQVLDADGTVVDTADSYAGLRSVAIRGKRILINGRPVFQRLVLDQGYWPDGLMTAPSDEALLKDITLAMDAGFNGARLHQKVFEERYLYHADRLGYLVWGEFGDWGCETGERDNNQRPDASYVAEWMEALERDYSHPSIIGWCPLNETYQHLHDRITQLDDVTQAMFLATKQADPTRPVVDASGYAHRVRETDVYDSHCYEQDPAVFAKAMSGLAENRPYVNAGPDGRPWSVAYRGQPYFCSEFGGIWWDPQAAQASGSKTDESWGYGDRPRTEEEFHDRFAGLTGVLLDDPDMFGYCYTQLTDVFQEQNGLYRFDRSVKLDIERIRQAQIRPASYENN